MKVRYLILLLLSALLLAACHSNLRQKTAQAKAAYDSAAGAEISSFTEPLRWVSWEPLGEKALVVYTRPNRAYLLDVSLCPDLPTASAIKLSAVAGEITSKLDKVYVGGSRYPCRIEHIRPLDLAKLHAAQNQRHNIGTMPRSSDTQGNR